MAADISTGLLREGWGVFNVKKRSVNFRSPKEILICCRKILRYHFYNSSNHAVKLSFYEFFSSLFTVRSELSFHPWLFFSICYFYFFPKTNGMAHFVLTMHQFLPSRGVAFIPLFTVVFLFSVFYYVSSKGTIPYDCQ